MKKLTTYLPRLCAAALILASTACSGVAGNDPAPALADSPAPVVSAMPAPAPVSAAAPVTASAPAGANLLQQIKTEIGTAACDSNQQCRTLPVGQRACGGPETYLAYSTKVSDAAKLQRMASEHSAAAKEQNTRSGMISTCQMIMDPGATCSAGNCVTASGANGPLPTR